MYLSSASGIRSFSNGKVVSVTIEGTYWSSSVEHASTALGTSFLSYKTRVDPFLGINRAYAYPVRCVQEGAYL